MPEFVECPSCHRSFNLALDACPHCHSQAALLSHQAPTGTGSETTSAMADSAEVRARIDDARQWESKRTRIESYQSAIGLGTFLQLLLGIATLIYAFAVWNDFAYRDALSGFEAGTISLDEAVAVEDRWGLSASIELIMYLVIGVIWVVWMWRLYRNVEALGRRRKHSIHWCIWGWVIPIGSLWIPRMITGDIWRKSDPSDLADPAARVPWIYNLWWGLFLVTVFVSRGIGFDEPATTAAWIDRVSAYIWLDGLGIILAFVSIFVVRDLTNRQSQAHQNLQAELRRTMPS